MPTAPYAKLTNPVMPAEMQGIYGNLKGITSILPLLAKIGYKTIELGPVYDAQIGKIPPAGQAYDANTVSPAMGYAAMDWFSVHPYYGSFDDYKTLLDQAHTMGIKVRQDVVVNHVSDQNPIFQESKAIDSPLRQAFFWRDPISIDENRFTSNDASIIYKNPENWLRFGGRDAGRTKVPFLRVALVNENDHPLYDSSGNRVYTEYMPFIQYFDSGHFEIIRNAQGALLFPPSDIRPFFGQTAWHLDAATNTCYLGRFGASMPDINCTVLGMEAIDSCKKWLALGVDGFRLDAAFWLHAMPEPCGNPFRDAARCSNPPAENTTVSAFSFANVGGQQRLDLGGEAAIRFWETFIQEINAEAERLYRLGHRDSPQLSFEFENGDQLNIWQRAQPRLERANAGQSKVRAYTAMTESVNTLADLRAAIEEHQRRFGNCDSIAFTHGNHDTKPLSYRLGFDNNPPAKRLLMKFLANLPGDLSFFQGHDLGLPLLSLADVKANDVYGIVADGVHQPANPQEKNHDSGRAAIPYFADGRDEVHKRYIAYLNEDSARCYETELADPNSFLQFVSTLLHQREQDPFMGRAGTVSFINTPNPDIIAFERSVEGINSKRTLIFNFSNQKVSLSLNNTPVTVEPYDVFVLDNENIAHRSQSLSR
jgi:glycosidase